MSITVRFWGVRGSIPTPGPETVIFGGNTSCISAELDNGAVLVFDSGTGIRDCGGYLLSKKKPVVASIFISHTHWDHIQGFPFFVPAYIPGNTLTLYGPPSDVRDRSLEKIMEMQTNYEYFPVSISQLGAKIGYIDAHEGEIETGIPGAKISACRLNHPVACLAYRVEYGGKTFIYGGDHEPYRNLYRDAQNMDIDEDFLKELDLSAEEQNGKIVEFCRGADAISWDSQYTAEEYQSKKGWGHGTYEANITLAEKAGVGRLCCSHHDPVSNDAKLRAAEEKYRALAAARGVNLCLSREGMVLEL